MRRGVPEVKMKDGLIKIMYFVHSGKGSTDHILLE